MARRRLRPIDCEALSSSPADCDPPAVVRAACTFIRECEIFFRGTDPLIKDRLALDSRTSFVDLQHARVALIQNNLWKPGPELSLLKDKIAQGMGLVLILGPDTSPESIAALTDGAVAQRGIARPLCEDSGDALEQHAAIIRYVGPHSDRLGRRVSWRSVTRVHERTIVEAKPSISESMTAGSSL